jgi:branched-chain amino acid aminotransferase
MEATDDGYDEALLLDSSGFVSEGAGENIFVIKNGVIYTPDLSAGALNGITRNTVFHICQGPGPGDRAKAHHPRRGLHRRRSLLHRHRRRSDAHPRAGPHRTGQRLARGPITEKIQSAFFDIVNGRNPKYAHWLSKV